MHFSLRLAFALLALALLVPGAASSQSAGDDQYVDPFAPTQGGGGGGGSGGSTGGGEEPVAPAPEPVAPEDSASTGSSAVAPVDQTSGGLPRTGLPSGLIAALGAALVLSGVALRRRA